ncbi:hypothetical protein HZB88_01860 [archaeon]|nr:hypothetical protein [archaeon]
MLKMNLKCMLLLFGIIAILLISGCIQEQEGKCGDGICDELEKEKGVCPEDCISGVEKPEAETTGIPYYFIAVHNEPSHSLPISGEAIEKAYPTLEQIVDKANKYNIKLTLMLSAQWADYISESPERLAKIKEWQSQGHEIAAHHHGVRHNNWDGYTDYSEEEAVSFRLKYVEEPEEYIGALDDYIQKLKKINPEIKSGCVDDEEDKNEMPNEIIYDTCSGFANFGEIGERLNDIPAEKGKNEFIMVGNWKGIQRKWLAHYQLYHDVNAGEEIFSSMSSGVYGVVVHSNPDQAEKLYEYLEFLHSKDPNAEKSRTLTEIIEQGLLPEKQLP